MITARQSATAKLIEDVISDENGPIDLTGSTVQFVIRGPTRIPLFHDAQIASPASSGVVAYELQPSDIIYSGHYEYEWHVTEIESGTVTIYPESGPRPLYVVDKISPI